LGRGFRSRRAGLFALTSYSENGGENL